MQRVSLWEGGKETARVSEREDLIKKKNREKGRSEQGRICFIPVLLLFRASWTRIAWIDVSGGCVKR